MPEASLFLQAEQEDVESPFHHSSDLELTACCGIVAAIPSSKLTACSCDFGSWTNLLHGWWGGSTCFAVQIDLFQQTCDAGSPCFNHAFTGHVPVQTKRLFFSDRAMDQFD